MDRYQNGKIYKIIDNTNGNIYIGSTCVPTLALRLAKHRTHYKQYLNGNSVFYTSFKILENGDYSIVLLEQCPCNTKDQLLARERYYIESNECVNKKIPTRTHKEWVEKNREHYLKQMKKYKEQNKDAIQKRKKIYNEINKEKLNEKITCECGGRYTYQNKSVHLKSLKHKTYTESLEKEK